MYTTSHTPTTNTHSNSDQLWYQRCDPFSHGFLRFIPTSVMHTACWRWGKVGASSWGVLQCSRVGKPSSDSGIECLLRISQVCITFPLILLDFLTFPLGFLPSGSASQSMKKKECKFWDMRVPPSPRLFVCCLGQRWTFMRRWSSTSRPTKCAIYGKFEFSNSRAQFEISNR